MTAEQAAFLAGFRRPCPQCDRHIALTRGGVRLSPHTVRGDDGPVPKGQPCPGSRTHVDDLPTPAGET